MVLVGAERSAGAGGNIARSLVGRNYSSDIVGDGYQSTFRIASWNGQCWNGKIKKCDQLTRDYGFL